MNEKKHFRRYRFKTYADDFRPIVFNPSFPWWCSGYGDGYAVIIAFLPRDEPLSKYWDDAFDVEFTEEKEITFSPRFPQPKWFRYGSSQS